MLVVVAPPSRDSNPRLSQAGKPVIVQTLIPKTAIEALDIGILRRLSCLDQLELNAILVSPLIQRLAGEFRPLVSTDCPRQPTKLVQLAPVHAPRIAPRYHAQPQDQWIPW